MDTESGVISQPSLSHMLVTEINLPVVINICFFATEGKFAFPIYGITFQTNAGIC